MSVKNCMRELIGFTPLLRLSNYEKARAVKARLTAKLEFLNPTGSIKDRTALAMLDDAFSSGALKEGGTVIEPTSGNTGIALAAIGASLGLKVIIVMPDSMSGERIKLIKAYGAEIVLTDGAEGMAGAIARARLIAQNSGGIILGQFDNPSNPRVHFLTTGPEIYAGCGGKIDIFVAGVGTGGTITGAGEYLKSKNPDIRVVAVEPSSSAVLSGGSAGAHKIQGIGAGFVPSVLNTGVLDEVITVGNEEAFSAVREIACTEGVLVGISSGAALAAATRVATRPENEEKNIVVLFPDSGDRYLSLF